MPWRHFDILFECMKIKSITANIAANYIAFIYVSGIGFVITPPLYQAVGATGYGLIGFYAILQAWFVMLDFGLSAALSRMCSRYKAGAVSNSEMLRNFQTIERIFFAIGGLGAALIMLAAKPISSTWFNLSGYLYSQAVISVAIMGIIVAFRWGSGLYRGILNGFERQVIASGVNIISATLRFPAAYLCVVIFKFNIQEFFIFQAVISILEFGALRYMARNELPREKEPEPQRTASQKTLFKFSAGVFWIGLTNTAIMQIDKIIISKKIGLENFGKFSLVIVLINVIGMLSAPIASALIPALSRVYAENRPYALYITYSKYWQLCTIFIGAVASMFITISFAILNVWVNDVSVAEEFSIPMIMYSIGNLIFSMASYAHYIQFATGNITLQLKYNTIFILTYIPLAIIAVEMYGVGGAAFVWAVFSSLGFLYITYAVHGRFMRPGYILWMKRYFLNSLASMLIAATLLSPIIHIAQTKTIILLTLISVTLLVAATGFIAPLNTRRSIKNFVALQFKFS